MRRPEVERDDFLNAKRKAPPSFVQRVAWSDPSFNDNDNGNGNGNGNDPSTGDRSNRFPLRQLLAVLVDDGRILLFNAQTLRSLSKARWYPPSLMQEGSTGEYPEIGRRAVDVLFMEDGGSTLCVLCEDCVLRRYDTNPCWLVEEENDHNDDDYDDDDNDEEDEGNIMTMIMEDSTTATRVVPISRFIVMPELSVGHVFRAVHRIVSCSSDSSCVWIFGILRDNSDNSNSNSNSGSNHSAFGCWDLSKDVSEMMLHAPIPLPTHGAHENTASDASENESSENDQKKTNSKNTGLCSRVCHCCCRRTTEVIRLNPHSVRCVSVCQGRLATVDLTGVVTVWSTLNQTPLLILAARNFPEVQDGEEMPLELKTMTNNDHSVRENGVSSGVEDQGQDHVSESGHQGKTGATTRRRLDRYSSFVDAEDNDFLRMSSCRVLPLVTGCAFVSHGQSLLLLHDDGTTTFLTLPSLSSSHTASSTAIIAAVTKRHHGMLHVTSRTLLCESRSGSSSRQNNVVVDHNNNRAAVLVTHHEEQEEHEEAEEDNIGNIGSNNTSSDLNNRSARADSISSTTSTRSTMSTTSESSSSTRKNLEEEEMGTGMVVCLNLMTPEEEVARLSRCEQWREACLLCEEYNVDR